MASSAVAEAAKKPKAIAAAVSLVLILESSGRGHCHGGHSASLAPRSPILKGSTPLVDGLDLRQPNNFISVVGMSAVCISNDSDADDSSSPSRLCPALTHRR